MAVNPYDPSQPTGTSQVELSAELRALKGVNVNHRDKIQALEDQIVPITDITEYGKDLIHLESVEDNLDFLGGMAAGIEVFQKPTVPDILDLLGLSGASMTIEAAAGKTCITWNTGLMLQIVNFDCPSGGETINWMHPFPTQVLGAIVGLNSTASNAAYIKDITTVSAFVDQENLSSHEVSVWALGR